MSCYVCGGASESFCVACEVDFTASKLTAFAWIAQRSRAVEREACARKMDQLSTAAAGRGKGACVLGVEASLAYRHGAEEIRARGGV